jgi:type IV secretory pathway VirD2 relaxase
VISRLIDQLGCAVSNIVHFQKPITTAVSSRPDLDAVLATLSTLPRRMSEIRKRQTEVKEDIRLTVLMLDLAVAEARRLINSAHDHQIKKGYEEHLRVIEELLDIARQKAITL